MNRIYIFILGSIMVCLQACHNYEEPLWDDKSMVQTRAIVDEYRPSSSNPDLLTNWENLEEIVLNTEKPTGGGYKVDVPWTDGISSNLSESFRKNIKKEDGWKMLFHTFKEVGLNKGLNYMCFYNQFIGCIKVFYYNEEAVLSQGAQWYIKTNGGIKTKMLDEVAYLSITAAEPATNDMLILSNLADVPTTGIVRGWNGFEFSFPYSTDLPIGDIKIGAYEKHITDYNITGKEFLTSLGTITTTQQSECTKLDGKEIAGLDMHSRLQFPLIYSDENRTFYETESYRTNINGDFSVSGNPQPLVCWYDWGDILTGKWLAVVCVDLKVEYEGKINDISQSRVYTVDFKVDDELSNMDDIINHPPYSVIINEGKPFFPAGYFYPLTDFWD